jgi:hypothetical protein
MKKPKRLFRRRAPRLPDTGPQTACRDQHEWVNLIDMGPECDDQGQYWDYQCQRCPAIGILCQWCFGTKYGYGGCYSTDPQRFDQTKPKEVCPRCRGRGIIEIVEMTLAEVQRLRAKAGES